MTVPTATDEPAIDLPPVAARLHQPWRALVALVEVVAAAAAIWGAFWCWPRGVATITLVLDDGTRLVSTRYYGNWMGAAILLGTIAALLVLDAVRQTVLAVRTHPKRASKHGVPS